MKKDFDEAQKESLVGDKKNKPKEKKKRDKTGEKEDRNGSLTRYTTNILRLDLLVVIYLLRLQRAPMKAHVHGNTSGFNPPPEKSFKVIFHVLLPKAVWDWDTTSHLHMRFSHPRLGEWKEDVGEFTVTRYGLLASNNAIIRQNNLFHRDLRNGLMEMECSLLIDSTLLKQGAPISYKYRVYTRCDEGEVSAFEFLHGAPKGRWNMPIITNRMLVIKEIKEHGKTNYCIYINWSLDFFVYIIGQYHQYDNMVYPENAKTKNFATKAWNYLVGESSKEEAVYVPDHETMQGKALEIFLDNYRIKLVGLELSLHLDVIQISKEIVSIFRQLYNQRIAHNLKERPWVARKLPAVSVW